jgi:hypothetical protein
MNSGSEGQAGWVKASTRVGGALSQGMLAAETDTRQHPGRSPVAHTFQQIHHGLL